MRVLVLIGFVLVCQIVGFAGSLPTMRAIPGWYANLRRPPWTPPNKVFAPVWTLLYLLMGIAAWQCWTAVGFAAWTLPFLIQLALNVGWSCLFFGLREVGLALVEMVGLWLCIAWCIYSMGSVAPVAGYLMVPYLLWVTYAFTLNAGFWLLNRSDAAQN